MKGEKAFKCILKPIFYEMDQYISLGWKQTSSQRKLNLEKKLFHFLTRENSNDNSLEGIYTNSTPKLGLHHAFSKTSTEKTG